MGNQNSAPDRPTCLLEPGLPNSCENMDSVEFLMNLEQTADSIEENS